MNNKQEQYFQQLTKHLQAFGTGMPQLIIDLERFDANLTRVKQLWRSRKKARLVVKSLASQALIKRAVAALDTQAFMVFHFPHLVEILEMYPQSDILLGKPMPIQTLKTSQPRWIQKHAQYVQWLIDSQDRLEQYLLWAKAEQCCLKVNLEIDIGLHRGGFTDPDQLAEALELIRCSPQYLQLSGLMGYDAHISQMPKLLGSSSRLYQKTQTRYQAFIDRIHAIFPDLHLSDLSLNGAGSATLMHHLDESVCNDLSLGSLLLKPADFELEALTEMQTALWIATPVLKYQHDLQLPELEKLSRLAPFSGIFVYGGYWRGQAAYPEGATLQVLYGRSSNQEMWQIPKKNDLAVGDYLFIHPSQSESTIPQFAHIYAYDGESFEAWTTFRE